jgi:tRNA pseudouridine38-40 synthase
MRYKLTLEYDGGSVFQGWQRLGRRDRACRAVIEAAVEQAHRRRSSDVIRFAGRTDAGVHAIGQVCACRYRQALSFAWTALGRRAERVSAAASGRCAPTRMRLRLISMHASTRRGGFISIRPFVNRRGPADARHAAIVWRVARRGSMAKRCTPRRIAWSVRHDFTTFRDSQCQAKSPVKTLDVAAM